MLALVAAPSAAGAHLPWDRAPAAVHAWAEGLIGPIVEAVSAPGGMSAGCVARLRSANGERVFVKATGSRPNARTPELYRREARVVAILPPISYRPAWRGTYDDGDWMALAFDDVEGHYPDLYDAGDRRAVQTLLARQAEELRGFQAPVSGFDQLVRRWLETWHAPGVHEIQPAWLVARRAELADRIAGAPERVPAEQLIHWDVRNDNLLIRPSGEVVIFDWGMSRIGPAWADLFLLALDRAEDPEFDHEVRQIGELVGAGPPDELVDELLVLLGTRLAYFARHRPEPGLPAISAFREVMAGKLFQAARRRMAP
jgi:Phosphotransferase enzyme family